MDKQRGGIVGVCERGSRVHVCVCVCVLEGGDWQASVCNNSGRREGE